MNVLIFFKSLIPIILIAGVSVSTLGMNFLKVTDDIIMQSEQSMGSMLLQNFNAQFETYKGSGKTGSQIKSLKTCVEMSNMNNVEHQVNIVMPEINNTSKYKVQFAYDGEGYITIIRVVEEI